MSQPCRTSLNKVTTKSLHLSPKTLLLALTLIIFFIWPITSSSQEATKEQDIILGMSTALSGPAADLGKNMRDGVLAGFHRINLAGGVNGKQLRLIVLDDGYEPARTAPNMRRLIEQEQVLAIIGNVGTPTAIAAIPIANEQKTLLYAPYTGAGVLRNTPPYRYVINYRASYAEETGAMIDALIEKAKLKPKDIAFFTQRDGYGDAGYIGGITALKRHGLKDDSTITHVRYERNTLAVENALADLLMPMSTPKAIIMVGAYAPCSKFIKLAETAGLKALYLNVSFVGSASLARDLGDKYQNVIVTQVVPHPLDSRVPIVQDYQKDLKAFNQTIRPTFGSLEGYIAARIFLDALKNIQGPLSRETVVNALEGLGSFDIGLNIPLHFGPLDHQASHRVWATILRDGKIKQFNWKDISGILNNARK
ncbi:MAG: ABC transporter substrate-binding protein [Nitrospirota bacterium]|nr:ABC transporter substrate-binding protein [Nitrospirota bacterium]